MNVIDWQHRFDQWISQHFNHGDAAHDVSHFRRVWKTAQTLMQGQQVDALVVLTACYFHDIVSFAKNHPQRHQSSVLAAEKTAAILESEFPDFPQNAVAGVRHAIEAHSFSADIAPQTLEAKIVQDADRLESLGAIGLARVFAVSGSMGAALFDGEDPFAAERELDDKAFALDHFRCKLLKLPATMQTEQGRKFAEHNADFLVHFMAKLSAELQGDHQRVDEEVLRRFSFHLA
ncbi:phosphohydrolase [Kosakonia sacchari]|uniref:phosphohydrolase n=1 Tax=Kosakonia sacchari TaxID=1158459 RepID=UPI0025B1885F|nr:phosphohydrolase [Kosakonia sacchari]MDN2486205.1 phosphohydrolase [Kosakonia sacchari]